MTVFHEPLIPDYITCSQVIQRSCESPSAVHKVQMELPVRRSANSAASDASPLHQCGSASEIENVRMKMEFMHCHASISAHDLFYFVLADHLENHTTVN